MRGEGSLPGKPWEQVKEETRNVSDAGEKNHAEVLWEMRLSGEVELDYCETWKPGRWIQV